MMRAEWETHEATWVAWPWIEDWGDELQRVRNAWVQMCEAIHGERLCVLVRNKADEGAVRSRLGHMNNLRIVITPYWDVWVRDTGPVFLEDGSAACFAFNGWGGKYLNDADQGLAGRMADAAGTPQVACDMVLEGGALETDGRGTFVATRDSVLHVNRGSLEAERVESTLAELMGAQRVVWIDGCLENDHTDGHVDTLVRFVAPGRVACMAPADGRDPNGRTLLRVEEQVRDLLPDCEVIRMPSPGRVNDARGRALPASYVNYYVTNHVVLVPQYGVAADMAAMEAVRKMFVGRRVKGIDAVGIITGGGAVHCITKDQVRV